MGAICSGPSRYQRRRRLPSYLDEEVFDEYRQNSNNNKRKPRQRVSSTFNRVNGIKNFHPKQHQGRIKHKPVKPRHSREIMYIFKFDGEENDGETTQESTRLHETARTDSMRLDETTAKSSFKFDSTKNSFKLDKTAISDSRLDKTTRSSTRLDSGTRTSARFDTDARSSARLDSGSRHRGKSDQIERQSSSKPSTKSMENSVSLPVMENNARLDEKSSRQSGKPMTRDIIRSGKHSKSLDVSEMDVADGPRFHTKRRRAQSESAAANSAKLEGSANAKIARPSSAKATKFGGAKSSSKRNNHVKSQVKFWAKVWFSIFSILTF